jgi:hypothetical protein
LILALRWSRMTGGFRKKKLIENQKLISKPGGKIQMKDFNVKKYVFGDLTVGAASEIGPRILFLSHAGSPEVNMMGVLPGAGVETPDGFWKIFGGHRLWTSPEAMPRSYSLDGARVVVEEQGNTVRITGREEKDNFVQKIIEISPHGEGARVRHIIRNTGRWPIKAACWALSVMARGGFGIVPVKPKKTDEAGLIPDRLLSLWPYTRLSDERLIFDGDFIFLKQTPGAAGPVKIGVKANPPLAGYWVGGNLFLKKFSRFSADYPDYGCDVELYSCGDFFELETLGPLSIIDPGRSIEHDEFWSVIPAGHMEPSACSAGPALGNI